MREAQEPERLRLAESLLLPALGGEPAELDQPRFLGRQLQVELREPAAKISEEPLAVITVLNAHDVFVGETHDDHIAARLPPPPPLGPQVQHVRQVHVRKQRRNKDLLITIVARLSRRF